MVVPPGSGAGYQIPAIRRTSVRRCCHCRGLADLRMLQCASGRHCRGFAALPVYPTSPTAWRWRGPSGPSLTVEMLGGERVALVNPTSLPTAWRWLGPSGPSLTVERLIHKRVALVNPTSLPTAWRWRGPSGSPLTVVLACDDVWPFVFQRTCRVESMGCRES